jgi:hypothetical protein
MELVEVEAPSSTERKVGAGHQILSPVQLIMFYPPAEWEQFIFEWVTARRELFAEVKRLGGAGDRGIDIAHLRTTQGLDGDWDCYQCKHYENAVNWSGILPELVKVFRHSASGDYTFPSKYVIVAPKGVSTDLENTLNSPERMQARFLDDLAKHWHEDAASLPRTCWKFSTNMLELVGIASDLEPHYQHVPLSPLHRPLSVTTRCRTSPNFLTCTASNSLR